MEEQRIPAGHDPANEPENANQSHDAALEIVHLRSNAAIPFPGLCCTCWWYGVTATNTQPTNAPLGYVTATVQRCNGAMRPTLQRSEYYRVRCVRRDLENCLLLRDPLRGITFPRRYL